MQTVRVDQRYSHRKGSRQIRITWPFRYIDLRRNGQFTLTKNKRKSDPSDKWDKDLFTLSRKQHRFQMGSQTLRESNLILTLSSDKNRKKQIRFRFA